MESILSLVFNAENVRMLVILEDKEYVDSRLAH
jgi:hypothetical protein